MLCRAIILLAAGLLAPPHPTSAHNGTVGYAVPVEHIALDGDFGDWPEDAAPHPVALHTHRDTLKDAADFSCTARFGYNAGENALYVAIAIVDDEVVIDDSVGATWSEQEFFLLVVDQTHPRGNAELSSFQLVGDTYTVGDFGDEKIALADAEVAIGRERGRRRYEWRVDIGKKSAGAVQLRPGAVLGVNVQITDHDSTRTGLQWAPGNISRAVGTGDLLLTTADPPWGRLAISASWAGGAPLQRGKVEIQSLVDSALWLRAATDRQGRAAVRLPPGAYALRAPGVRDTVELVAGQEQALSLELPPPQGTIAGSGPGTAVPAGSGQVRPAGAGTRQSLWRHFGLADGLPGSSVQRLLRDRRGHLWIGTQSAGAIRYDGTEFVQFTAEDGLAHDQIQAIAEDAAGDLWFGTVGGGVSRYDGQTFRTFTTQDGLASDTVWTLASDARNHLWFGTAGGVSRYDGQDFTHYGPEQGWSIGHVSTIVEDAAGDLWFITADEGVIGYQRGTAPRLVYYTDEDGLGTSWGNASAAAHPEDGVWIGTQLGIKRLADGQITALDNMTQVAGWTWWWTPQILTDARGDLWWHQGHLVARYDGQHLAEFTSDSGLSSNEIWAIAADGQGGLWCGYKGGGLSYYEAARLRNFTSDDGLTGNRVYDVLEDRQGRVWAGSFALDLFDGRRFAQFEELIGIRGLSEDAAGNLWIGANVGAYRYDGTRVEKIEIKGGVSDPGVKRIATDSQGHIWFTSWFGAARYDGTTTTDFTVADGLPSNRVTYILEDRQDRMWFATGDKGVSRYDGQRFTNFTVADSLATDGVGSILEDRQGLLWFGTGKGLSRYDGQTWQTFTTADGLSSDNITGLMQDRRGRLWISTWGGGVNLYDGQIFQHLLQADGLGSNVTMNISQGPSGDVWISTYGGATRYQPSQVPPTIRLLNATSDRAHGPVAALALPTTQDYLLIEFQGTSFTTRAERMVYYYRLRGHQDDWRPTRQRQVTYRDLPAGDYIFEIQAVDRDLNYSEPAQLRIAVRPPYGQYALFAGFGLALFGLALATGYGLRQRRQARRAERALLQELEDELQTARELQMSLMPTGSPKIPSLDIAGHCQTVNHVGGDFFQYFERDGSIALCLADVTGHAMEAAVPVMMFSGVLKSQMELGESLETLFTRLNHTLYGALERRTFVCFAMGELSLGPDRRLRLANSGCPYPYHYRAASDELVELQIDAFPLGIRPAAAYNAVETSLDAGDYLIFCSDGLIEAANPSAEIFGFERTAAEIASGCRAQLSADALIERLIGTIQAFAGDEPQGDDMTCVVMRME